MKVDFQKIAPIKDADEYFESALKKASKKVSSLKNSTHNDMKNKELERINIIRDSLIKYLDKISTTFPNIDILPAFYIKMIDESFEYNKLKKSLGSIKFAKDNIKRLTREYSSLIKLQEERKEISKFIKAYFGRVISILKQINKNFRFLDEARKILRKFPALDVEDFTVAITGFPNVGKSTLLSKLTSAKPKINSYAFTTKGLNVGSFEYKFHKIQLVDTPGTLARIKENIIERLAIITRNYLAKTTIFVFDITEPFPIQDQKRLFEEIRKEGKPIILYLSKIDILKKEDVIKFIKEYPSILTNPDDVKKEIIRHFNNWL